jgi:hypothetical protein
LVHSSKGFEKDETCQGVAEIIVKLAEQLKLEIDVDVEELTESHGAELPNGDLIKLEGANVAERTEAECIYEPDEEPRRCSAKEMAIAFRKIASAMAGFEKKDPSSSRFLEVNIVVEDTMACYREIYAEKKKATV